MAMGWIETFFSLEIQDTFVYQAQVVQWKMCLDEGNRILRKGKNALKLNYTGGKESYNWSLFKTAFLSLVHQGQNVFNKKYLENWLCKHHLKRVMPINNI